MRMALILLVSRTSQERDVDSSTAALAAVAAFDSTASSRASAKSLGKPRATAAVGSETAAASAPQLPRAVAMVVGARRRFTRTLAQALASVATRGLVAQPMPSHHLRPPPSSSSSSAAVDEAPFRMAVDVLCTSYAQLTASVPADRVSADVPLALSRLSTRVHAAALRSRAELAELERGGEAAAPATRHALQSAQAAVHVASVRRSELQARLLQLVVQVGAHAMRRFDGLAAPALAAGGGPGAVRSALLAPVVALTPALAHCLALPSDVPALGSSTAGSLSAKRALAVSGAPPPRLGAAALRPFRTLWVYLLSCRDAAEAAPRVAWMQEWQAAVRTIALRSPVLVARGVNTIFDTDVGVAAGGVPSAARVSFPLESLVAEQVGRSRFGWRLALRLLLMLFLLIRLLYSEPR